MSDEIATLTTFRVRVSESRVEQIAGGDLSYLSPPHEVHDARALLRAVLDFDPPFRGPQSWRRPVAGGIRTVELLEVDDAD